MHYVSIVPSFQIMSHLCGYITRCVFALLSLQFIRCCFFVCMLVSVMYYIHKICACVCSNNLVLDMQSMFVLRLIHIIMHVGLTGSCYWKLRLSNRVQTNKS